MSRLYRVALIKGDGIGPEVIGEAARIVEALVPSIEFIEVEAGYSYYKRTGSMVEEGALDVFRSVDAVLKGPLTTPPGPGTMRSVNVYIRRMLDLYANVRPFESYKGISLRQGFSFTIIRENLEGLYSGVEWRAGSAAFTVRIISEGEARRLISYAFDYAKRRELKRITLVHKANILKESDGLFRSVFRDEAERRRWRGVEEVIVDAAAYRMVRNPLSFEILVAPNLYGDILSDLAAGLVGSIGLCGSAQIGPNSAVFEPVHGSAPDIAGSGIANPIGAVKAAQLMLEYMAEKRGDTVLADRSRILGEAVRRVLEEKKIYTPDLGGSYRTRDVGEAILRTALELAREAP